VAVATSEANLPKVFFHESKEAKGGNFMTKNESENGNSSPFTEILKIEYEIFKFQTKLLQALKEPQNKILIQDLTEEEKQIDSSLKNLQEKYNNN